jgi:phage FluMu gp28-like protein
MAAVGWRMIRRLAVQIPGVSIREMDRLITMPGGGTIQVRSADHPDSLRGEGLDYLVLDECAFIKEDAWSEALRPALADRQGRALFISTPKGRNWFWRLWTAASTENDWRAWRFTSYDNPFIKASEIDAARELLPERVFRQEFMAEFIEDGGGVFRRVAEAATATEQERAVEGHEYVMGVDWGKSNDWTVLTLVDVTESALVHVDRFNRIDYQVQLGRLHGLYERFKPYSIIAERNSMGEPLVEQLQRSGLPVTGFHTSNSTKSTAVDALALAFERSDLRILPDATLIAELQAYEMERLPQGLLRYNAPSGMHDDCVMSLALAWQAVAVGKPQAVENPFYN